MRTTLTVLFLSCLSFLGAIALSGCQTQGVVLPAHVLPFTPVSIEFVRLREDSEVENIITKHLFCQECLFQKSETEDSPYCLKIHYDRRMDLKSLGLFFLSAALGPIKAEFTYYLGVQVLENERVIREYEYERITKEYTDSAFGSMFNPFHKANGRSDEIFAELIDNFLQVALIDKPLPQ